MSYQFPKPPVEAWQDVLGDNADRYIKRLRGIVSNTMTEEAIVVRVFWLWYSKNVPMRDIDGAIEIFELATTLVSPGKSAKYAIARFCALLEERHVEGFSMAHSKYAHEFGIKAEDVDSSINQIDTEGKSSSDIMRDAIIGVARSNMNLQEINREEGK